LPPDPNKYGSHGGTQERELTLEYVLYVIINMRSIITVWWTLAYMCNEIEIITATVKRLPREVTMRQYILLTHSPSDFPAMLLRTP
jgi:hypothetical protein